MRGAQEKGFFEVGQVAEHRVDGGRPPLALQEIGDPLGRNQVADVVHGEPRHRLEQRYVAKPMAADDVPDDDGAEDVLQHLGHHHVAQIGMHEPRQPSVTEVTAQERIGVEIVAAQTMQIAQLAQRQREYLQGHVAAGDMGGKLAGQHRRIGAGDDHLRALTAVQRRRRPLPTVDLLHLVDDHRERLGRSGPALYEIDQVPSRTDVIELQRLLVDVDDVAVPAQRVRELAQQHALADAPQPDDGDDRGSGEKPPQPVEIGGPGEYHDVRV